MPFLLLLLLTACLPSLGPAKDTRSRDSSVGDTAADTAAPPVDADQDGFTTDVDCDDERSDVNPAAADGCDGLDNDCDDQIDEEGELWYVDADHDGWGDTGTSTVSCIQPDGHVANDEDCNDQDSSIHPETAERCNQVDDDCDGVVDDDADTLWYEDGDGDGWGDDSFAVTTCPGPSGFVRVGGDCDDRTAAVHPEAEEACDGLDNDCDGDVDEEAAPVTWYQDRDADGYGNSSVTVESCADVDGYVTTSGDCNDRDAGTHPWATETCDWWDNDCDGLSDEGVSTTWYLDLDGDGWGDAESPLTTCDTPTGYSTNGDDCNDHDSSYHPGAYDLPGDGLDTNCDGAP